MVLRQSDLSSTGCYIELSPTRDTNILYQLDQYKSSEMDTDAEWQLHETKQRLAAGMPWLCRWCEHCQVFTFRGAGFNGLSSLTR